MHRAMHQCWNEQCAEKSEKIKAGQCVGPWLLWRLGWARSFAIVILSYLSALNSWRKERYAERRKENQTGLRSASTASTRVSFSMYRSLSLDARVCQDRSRDSLPSIRFTFDYCSFPAVAFSIAPIHHSWKREYTIIEIRREGKRRIEINVSRNLISR